MRSPHPRWRLRSAAGGAAESAAGAARSPDISSFLASLDHNSGSGATRGSENCARQGQQHQAEVKAVLEKPFHRTLLDLPNAPRHGIQAQRKRGGQAGGIVAQDKIFSTNHFEAAEREEALTIALTRIE